MTGKLRAIEFFSGIGGFAQAIARNSLPVEIVTAFDQDCDANRTYAQNYGLSPQSRNLDSISAHDLPESELWWLSPSCKPYTRRGVSRDIEDPRALSLLNLITAIGIRRPEILLLENVLPFRDSLVYQRLAHTLRASGYEWREFTLCPTLFGVPMHRPRFFLAAKHESSRSSMRSHNGGHMGAEAIAGNQETSKSKIADFLGHSCQAKDLLLQESLLKRYGESLNIVSPDQDAVLICFTSGYARSMRASGSFLREGDGVVRRFAPEEITRLLAFAEDFRFPREIALTKQWRLAGNSVDVRSIDRLLQFVIS